MPIAIASGQADVLQSGMVTTFGGSPLTLLLLLPEGRFNVDLEFGSDPEIDDVAIQVEQTDHGLAFHLTNFNTDEGRGSAVPILLGELGEDLVFLHFRVFRFGRTPDRTVHYTFYRVAKAKVSWAPGGEDVA